MNVQPLAKLSACRISLIEWLPRRQARLARCSHTTRARPERNEEINPFCATGSRGRNKLIAWCDVSLSLHSRQHQNRQPTKASCLCSAGPTGGWLTWYEPDSPHYGNMWFVECLRHSACLRHLACMPQALGKAPKTLRVALGKSPKTLSRQPVSGNARTGNQSDHITSPRWNLIGICKYISNEQWPLIILLLVESQYYF